MNDSTRPPAVDPGSLRLFYPVAEGETVTFTAAPVTYEEMQAYVQSARDLNPAHKSYENTLIWGELIGCPRPILAGAVLVPALLSTAICQNAFSLWLGRWTTIMGLDKLRFRKPLFVGEEVLIKITLLQENIGPSSTYAKCHVEIHAVLPNGESLKLDETEVTLKAPYAV